MDFFFQGELRPRNERAEGSALEEGGRALRPGHGTTASTTAAGTAGTAQALLLGYDLGTMPTFNDCFFNDCF